MKRNEFKRSGRRVAAAMAACLLASGCASVTPDYDARFGEAVRASREAQILDPRAGDNPDLAMGLDGGASREAMQRYRESFKAPPPVVNVINIGGGGR